MQAVKLEKQVFTVQCGHLTLEIRYSPKPFASADIEHFEIITIEPERCTPHPLSDTGYKSLFIHPEWTRQSGGAESFIKFALEEAAKKPEWKDYLAASQQLSLF